MKILILSLLRAGDILMQKPLFKSLREQNPGAELHLVLNDESAWIQPLLTDITEFHIFPRGQLQKYMGIADHNLWRANVEIYNFCEKINQNHFAQLINFTHTRLSAYLAEEIRADQKKGLLSEGARFTGLASPWLRLFNERFSAKADFSFHYVEILARSFGIPLPAQTAAARAPIRRIFLQAFTSDTKKNWSILNFKNLLHRLYDLFPDVSFHVLCAQKEKTQLTSHFEEEELCDWNFPELAERFAPGDLVVTGDTSVMHLAAENGIPVLELALGSADPRRTGPYGAGHWVLTAAVPCAPCRHSQKCSQLSHLCGDSVSPALVASVIQQIVSQKEIRFDHSVVKLYETSLSQEMGYQLRLLNLSSDALDVNILNKILWKKIFTPDEEMAISGLRASGASAAEFIESQDELKRTLSFWQSHFEDLIAKLGKNEISLSDVQASRRALAALSLDNPWNREWLWLFQDLGNLSFSSPLHYLSAFQDRLEQFKAAVFYREEIINTLKGGAHEPRTGKLSSGRFAEA